MAELKQKFTKMAQAVIEEKDEKPEGEFPSWSARILNWIGCTFIAKPADLGTPPMPPDWYFAQADRVMPAPGQDSWQLQRYRVYADNLRMEMKLRLARIAIVFNFVVIIALAALLATVGVAKFAKSAWDQRSSNNAAQQQRAESDQERRARMMGGQGGGSMQQEFEQFQREQRQLRGH